MTKTHKNLISFTNNTISGFERTLNVAMENKWDLNSLSRLLDNDIDSVHGALMFAKIYEEKITEEDMDELMKKLFDAKWQTINIFMGWN